MLFKKALGTKLEKSKHDGTNQTNFWRNLMYDLSKHNGSILRAQRVNKRYKSYCKYNQMISMIGGGVILFGLLGLLTILAFCM